MPACGRKVAGRWGISVAHVVIFENFCKLSLLSDQIGESELVPVLSAGPGAGAGCSHLTFYETEQPRPSASAPQAALEMQVV